jgi:hypothetical protein
MTPRAKFIKHASQRHIAQKAWDALMMASTHDPDLVKDIKRLEDLIYAEVKLQDRRFADICGRLSIIERQLQRLGAPQYRVIYKGKKAA